MPNGSLSPSQLEALQPFVEGRIVHDIGAGDLCLAQSLCVAGARKVVAIDKVTMPRPPNEHIVPVVSYFARFKDPIETAFVSWPVNWPEAGLLDLVSNSDRVIYLGTNTDGTACGDPILFHHLSQREVLAHVPEFRNTLIVYGPCTETRDLLPEEKAALDPSRMYSFAEVHAIDVDQLRGERDRALAEVFRLKAEILDLQRKRKRRARS
jgi:hypothetical protein